MKKQILVGVVAAFTIMLFACVDDTSNNKKILGLVGVINSGPSRIYKINQNSGSNVHFNVVRMAMAGQNPQNSKQAEFDENGQVIRVRNLKGNGVQEGYYDYDFDTDHKPTKRFCKENNGNMWYQYHYAYNADKKLAHYYGKTNAGVTQSYAEYEYNVNKHLVLVQKWTDDIKAIRNYRCTMEYNTDGLVIMAYVTEGGAPCVRYSFTYSGNTRHVDIYNNATEGNAGSGAFNTYRVFVYNDKGDVVNVYFADSNTERVYEYVEESVPVDNTGNWQNWYSLGCPLNNLVDPPQ